MFKDEYTRDELVENVSFDPINHISSSTELGEELLRIFKIILE